MKILVIDDDLDVAEVVRRALKEHSVMIENDSTTGVARVTKAELDGQPFELVLCEFNMSGMNGLDVRAAVQAHREPPIFILMSGYDDIVAITSFEDDVLLKPLRSSELHDLIERTKASRAHAKTRRVRLIRVASC